MFNQRINAYNSKIEFFPGVRQAIDQERRRYALKMGLAMASVAFPVLFGAGAMPPVMGANALYDAGRAAFLNAGIDMTNDDIIVLLVDGGVYTPNLSTHDFLDDITGGSIVATSDPFTGKTTTAGVFDADDVLLPSVAAGQDGTYLILVQDTGVSSTSRLIGKIDTGTNLPVTPNGGDITIAWSSGSSKIFKL